MATVLASESPSYEALKEVSVEELGTTPQVVVGAAASLHSVTVDNELNSAPTYLKLYDKVGAAHASDEPDWQFKVPAGKSGEYTCEHLTAAAVNIISAASAVEVAAAVGPAKTDTAPVSAFDCTIGVMP